MVQTLLQTIKTSPIRLWVSGQMNSTLYDDVEPEQLLHYDAEGIVDSDDNETDNDRPIFCPSTEEDLTDDVLSALQREVLFRSHPENYGIGCFIKAKIIIKVHYTE